MVLAMPSHRKGTVFKWIAVLLSIWLECHLPFFHHAHLRIFHLQRNAQRAVRETALSLPLNVVGALGGQKEKGVIILLPRSEGELGKAQ